MGEKLEIEQDKEALAFNLTFKDVVDIIDIIDHSTCKELDLELADLKLMVEKK